MKVNIEIDMTPEEARVFMGLPDVASLHKQMLVEMQERMKAALDAKDPDAMMRAWMPLVPGPGMEAFQSFQKRMWDSAAQALKKGGE